MHRSTYQLRMDGVDAFGIVYFAQYWQWTQHAIEALMESAGHPLRAILDSGIGFPLVHADIDFHQPLFLSDVVDAEASLVEAGTRSLHFEVRFFRGGVLVADARTVQVAVHRDMRPAHIPSWLRDLSEPAEPVDTPDTGE